MIKKILTKKVKANMFQISQNPLVNMTFYAIIGAAVIGFIGYMFTSQKADEASTYGKQLNAYLNTQYSKAPTDFILKDYMDANGKYVKINGQNTNTIYKYVVKGTMLGYTGDDITTQTTLDISDDGNNTLTGLAAGQVGVIMFTQSQDLTACTNKNEGGNIKTIDPDDTVSNKDSDTDLCRGYDNSINKVLVVGKPATIQSIYKDVFKNSSKYHTLSVSVDKGSATLSGLVLPTE